MCAILVAQLLSCASCLARCFAGLGQEAETGSGEAPTTNPPGLPSILLIPARITTSKHLRRSQCRAAPQSPWPEIAGLLLSTAPTATPHSSSGRAPDASLYVSGLNLIICYGRAACTVLPLLPRRFCHLFLLWEFMAQNTSDGTVSVSFLCCSYGFCTALWTEW